MRTIVTAAAAGVLSSLLAACGNTVASPGDDGRVRTEAVPELTCPARWEGTREHWVPHPAPPALDSRLVPDDKPATAVLCRYDGSNLRSFEGTEPAWQRNPPSRALTTALDALGELSAKDPDTATVCTLMGGPQRNYLLGLAYANGEVVWVFGADDPNSCVPASNGRFTTQRSAKSIFVELAEATQTADESG